MTPLTILTLLVDDFVLRECTLDDPPLDLYLKTMLRPHGSVLTLEQPTGTRHRFTMAYEDGPSTVTEACICDECAASFRLQAFHAGFSDIAYFYSTSGRHTLVVPGHVPGAPVPLSTPDPVALAALEARLPHAPDGSRFSYLNGLRCPACKAPYIDFASHPEIREKEYYGHSFFGERVIEFA